MTISTSHVLGNTGTSGFGLDSTVFLEFASGQTSGDSAITNRIMLRCQGVSISTNKRANSTPIPFSGIITGESRTITFDLGISTKSVTINGGVILDQIISRRYEDGSVKNKVMTSYEVAQLIHSSIDSSFAQPSQNLNKLTILYPSRVDKNYAYHSGVTETTTHEELPLLPFTWASRELDQQNTAGANTFPSTTATSAFTSIEGITGFIDNFSTTFESGGVVSFQLGFQEAIAIALT